jgi:MtfA peptidase
MQLHWPFHARRTEIICRPFPQEWDILLRKMVRHYVLLTSEEQTRLQGDLRILMDEKNWEGALGFEISDEVQVVISALASLLTVGFEKHEYFPNVQTIIVYPTSYSAPSYSAEGMVVEQSAEGRLGEAHGIGPIILSWSDVVAGGAPNTGRHSLVQHEFAHKLDFRDGDANGVPLLKDSAEVDDWAAVMSAEFEQLVDDVNHHRHTVLRAYGATNPAEFFAVCTECYFEKAVRMRDQKPELYRVLREYYGIDWAQRILDTA